MIQNVRVDEIPCFGAGSPALEPLAQITFVYGPNGAGKSSIAKKLHATGEIESAPELFDKEFVQRLLRPDQRMPGVFVIRDGDPEVQSRIDELVGATSQDGKNERQGEIEAAEKEVDKLKRTIEKKKQTIEESEVEATSKLWKERKKLPEKLQDAFEGFKGSKEKNFEEAVRIRKTTSDKDVKTEKELLETYDKLGEGGAQPLIKLAQLDAIGELTSKQVEVLKEPIKSRDETSFGEFTRRLGNSDWVRQGLSFLGDSQGHCPFCQQSVEEHTVAAITALFDEFYEAQVQDVREILRDEESRAQKVRAFRSQIGESSLDEIPNILKAVDALQSRLDARIQNVESKLAAPTSHVELSSAEDFVDHLHELITDANSRVEEVNALHRDRERAKRDLRNEVWRYYVHSCVSNELSKHEGVTTGPQKALAGLDSKIVYSKQLLQDRKEELLSLQSKLTSAIPTVEEINRTLRSLGFLSFSIEHIGEDDSYQLVREDGSIASDTLSEGERTLVSFLYYYHKLIRSNQDKSLSEEVVAVVDDPVSSLDGEMLFVINMLLRDLLKTCVDGNGRLRQVFLLTHNAYFFKEAAYTPNKVSPGHRSYFVLTKGRGGKTTFKHYEKSPIKSNYSQLWDQVRAAESENGAGSSAALPNAMRRIIENYFHIAGGLDAGEIIAEIDESNRWACRALLAWINDGSHTAPWDVDYSSIESDATTYLRAFRQIFEAANHRAHYDMMMNAES